MNYVIVIIVTFFILLWWVYKWSHTEIDNQSIDIRRKTGNEILEILSDIIYNTNRIPTENLTKEEYYMRDYIIKYTFTDLCGHPKYFSETPIIAYREIYDKVNRYYNLITPEGKITRRNELIEEILK